MPAVDKSHFAQFPKFTALTVNDKDAYEEFIYRFPPCGMLAFGSLMTWWSALDAPKVAWHGENLIISLWLPGHEEYSGLTVLGEKSIDETICAVFDFQRERGEEPRLTHVPEFVVSKIRFPEMFRFDGERDHDECIVDVDTLANPSSLPLHKQWKLNRFFSEFGEDRAKIGLVDLTSVYERDKLLEKVENWRDKGGLNTSSRHEEDCIKRAITLGDKYGLYSVGLFVDDNLEAFVIMEKSPYEGYEHITYGRFSYGFPYFMEMTIYKYAEWFKSEGVKMVNIEADFGIPVLRQIKLSMSPRNFLRMYTIQPAKKSR